MSEPMVIAYRQNADIARTRAEDCTDPETRSFFMEAAARYDRLADEMESYVHAAS